MPAGPRSRHRGFSLVESVVVVMLIGIASSAVVYWAGRPASVDQDIAAKAALTSVYEAQVNARVAGSEALDSAAMQTLDPTRRFVTGASTDPDTVSLVVQGSLVLAATWTGADCWLLRMETAPSSASPERVAWFVVPGTAACSAADAAGPALPGDGTGLTPDRPAVVES